MLIVLNDERYFSGFEFSINIMFFILLFYWEVKEEVYFYVIVWRLMFFKKVMIS